jgi:hypothetical protein
MLLSFELDRHRRKEVPLVHSIQQVLTESAAADISGRPDPDSRHGSADSVDDLPGNSLGFHGARRSLFEAGVEFPQSFLWRFLGGPTAGGRHRLSSTALGLLRSCHVSILAEGGRAWKDYPAAGGGKQVPPVSLRSRVGMTKHLQKGKRQSDFSDWPLLMPATTGVYTELVSAGKSISA